MGHSIPLGNPLHCQAIHQEHPHTAVLLLGQKGLDPHEQRGPLLRPFRFQQRGKQHVLNGFASGPVCGKPDAVVVVIAAGRFDFPVIAVRDGLPV